MGTMGDDWFDDSDYFTGSALSDEMVCAAETKVGYRLPESYLRLIRMKNGGSLKRSCFPTPVPTSWASDHIMIEGIRGIGGEWGIDSDGLGSREMIEEWGYPDVGVVIAETPAAGHTTVMLDYSECGPRGEPCVIWVDTETSTGEPEVLVLAPDFQTFLNSLVDCSELQDEEAATEKAEA